MGPTRAAFISLNPRAMPSVNRSTITEFHSARTTPTRKPLPSKPEEIVGRRSPEVINETL